MENKWYNQIERGLSCPKDDTLRALAQKIGVVFQVLRGNVKTCV